MNIPTIYKTHHVGPNILTSKNTYKSSRSYKKIRRKLEIMLFENITNMLSQCFYKVNKNILGLYLTLKY